MRQLHPDGHEFDFDSASADEIAVFLADGAVAAGPAVMDVYEQGGDVWSKSDGSPVTVADQRAEAIVCEKLSQAFPPTPIIAEESMSLGKPAAVADRFLLVDPLDGTKEFLARNGEFTINIALIRKGLPVAGAVYAPALGRLWFGGEHAFVCEAPVGGGLPNRDAWRPITVRQAPEALVVLASRSHGDSQTEAFLSRLPIAERRSRGSSLKFCVIAEGLADVYPRFGPTMEWDTAAGDAVLRAAGGVVLDPSDASLVYGKTADGLRNGPFVAWGDAETARRFAVREGL
ncbi:MAG TPA: 3'(2'),5'-bisphosphate nucleotidase CysQ [Roseiarcus sp.]|nr:3'(2'),5'-bisphosphate nucleotidase CysQ [Roseiarcus sp.]